MNQPTKNSSQEETCVPMRPQTVRSGKLMRAVAFLCVGVLFAADAMAQQATAKIVGTITDPQGAVVPGVKVTVTNTATNVASETTTGKDGFYQVLDLPIGMYRIVARHQGFRALELLTAPLEINQSFRADIRLEVGAVTEQVLVEAQGTGVETVNPTLGQSITSRPIVNMPLNGRNVLSLALLQPGVTEDNPDDGSTTQGFNIAGGRTDSVTYLLDGGLNNDLISNGVVYNPNPDSVAEFRILTSNYTAEYGRSGAGIISVVTKSGSNQFHGQRLRVLAQYRVRRQRLFQYSGRHTEEQSQTQPIWRNVRWSDPEKPTFPFCCLPGATPSTNRRPTGTTDLHDG